MIQNLEERAEKAMNDLSETDTEHAELKAKLGYLQELRKTVVAMGFEDTTGAQEQRRQAAHNTPELKAHLELILETETQYHILNNRRNTAIALIELYRTESANRRRG